MIRHAAVVVAEPVMRRTNGQRSAATQAQVLDAAIDCLVELGYARTTTTEVARRAGVSRGAQTHHFPTKDDLVLAAIDHLLARRNREFQQAFVALPEAQRTPASAVRILRDRCFGETFDAWLELVVAARTDTKLHERFRKSRTDSWNNRSTRSSPCSPQWTIAPIAQVALNLAFSVLDGVAIHRILGASETVRNDTIEAFNMLVETVFPAEGAGTS